MTEYNLSDLTYVPGLPGENMSPSEGLSAAMRALTEDGDTFDLANGNKLRLNVCADENASVNDYESDGEVQWTNNGDHGAVRPDHFTGTARIIDRDHNLSLWWQPPSAESIGTVWTPEQMQSEQDRITDLVRFGFRIVTLTLVEVVTDSRGNEHEVDVADNSLGGVDAMYEGIVGEIVGEMVGEMVGELIA